VFNMIEPSYSNLFARLTFAGLDLKSMIQFLATNLPFV